MPDRRRQCGKLTQNRPRHRDPQAAETYNRNLPRCKCPDCHNRTETALRVALLEPYIPQKAGAIPHLGACIGACMGVAVDLLEPCGFVLAVRRLCRDGMDYIARAAMVRHRSRDDFTTACGAHGGRLMLLATAAPVAFHRFALDSDDTRLLDCESARVPDAVHALADAQVKIPMAAGS